LYEEGRFNNGYNLFIKDGSLYGSAFNFALSSAPRKSFGLVSTSILADTVYTATFVHQFGVGVRLYVDGEKVSEATFTGKLQAHWGQISLGDTFDGTVDFSTFDSSTGMQETNLISETVNFNGEVGEFFYFHGAANNAEARALHDYYVHHWNLIEDLITQLSYQPPNLTNSTNHHNHQHTRHSQNNHNRHHPRNRHRHNR